MTLTLKAALKAAARTGAVLAAFCAVPGTAAQAANFTFEDFGGSATAQDGSRATQAGAHPDVETHFRLSTQVGDDGVRRLDANLKDVSVDLPAGLVGDPHATAKCTPKDLAAFAAGAACARDTQVGVVYADYVFDAATGGAVSQERVGVYNIPAPPGVAARLGFQIVGTVVLLDARLTTDGEYRISIVSTNTSQGVAVSAFKAVLWGVPSDPKNHPAGQAPNLPRRPFITAPTSCPDRALTTKLTINSWQFPDEKLTASFDADPDGLPIVSENCGALEFDPSLAMRTSTSDADAPTGIDVALKLPQNDSPDGLATSHLKDATVSLPAGTTINPGSASGLTACTDAEFGLGNNDPAGCADSSKVGSVTAKTPLLDDTLAGSVYVLSQASDDPESGQMFRVGMDLVNKDRAINVKLGGNLVVNKDTGQITAQFKDNPQTPVSDINLSFKSGPRAPLATPASCGAKSAPSTLTGWSGKTANLVAGFGIACSSGLGGFAPRLSAGTVSPRAGASSPFVVNAVKPDGNVAVNGLSMVLPTGLLAKSKGNLGTQVGSVKVFAGPGSNPYMLPGQVFLEGAYGDAPFSLKVVVPAKAGPFDLGEVVVRQKIYVDPIDAHVTVVSDPLPTIVKGVPVRLQRLEVNVDKPGFVVNPTSCAPKTIGGTLGGADGQTAPIDVRFQVGECGSLTLEPALALSLSGKGQTTDGKHPAVTANLSQPAGQANLKKVRVALPLSLALDTDNANGLCEFADGSKVTPTCPKSSIVGTASAVSPILNEPLSGPVYFVKNVRKNARTGKDIKTLPKLVIPLVGENGVKLTLTGTSDVEDNHLVTTFDNIPDAPVSSFKLNINGGKGGILAVSGSDICKSTQVADQQVDGQNNKAADTDVVIQTPSCPTKVISKKVTAKSVVLKVGGLGAGKVTVSGRGIRKTTKTIAKSTVATITARRAKGRLGKVKVSFVAAGSKKAKSTSVTLR